VINENNWDVVKKQKVWGVSERNRRQLEGVKIGDLLIFYVKASRIAGIYKAISKMFESDVKIFSSAGFAAEIFPYRIKVEPKLVPKRSKEIKPLIPQLEFLKRKDKKWGTTIFGKAMKGISEEDYKLMESSLRER